MIKRKVSRFVTLRRKQTIHVFQHNRDYGNQHRQTGKSALHLLSEL